MGFGKKCDVEGGDENKRGQMDGLPLAKLEKSLG